MRSVSQKEIMIPDLRQKKGYLMPNNDSFKDLVLDAKSKIQFAKPHKDSFKQSNSQLNLSIP